MKGADFFVDGPPPGLVEALNWGRCLLFAGSSLSQAAGYPSWSQSARDLLQFGNDIGILDPPYADSLFKSVEMGEIDYVLDTIANQLENRERQEDLAKFLQRGYIDPQYPPTDLHALLGTLPFMAAITPNYDDLLERTFANRPKAKPYHIFASRHAAVDDFPYFEAMQRALEKGAFFFLKLRG